VTSTIAAIATPPGNGGVGIVRVSGPGALSIAAAVLRRQLPPRRAVVTAVYAPGSGERIDEVLALAMPGPRSYTGEDIAELQAHGGAENLARVLAAVLAAGAVPAAPGEFTRRAFENGRIDLTQAEAVAGVIAAGSERALRAAQRQLAGELGEKIEGLRRDATEALAGLEASIDFPEEGLSFLGPDGLLQRVEEGVRALLATRAVGRALHDGLEVALVGAPNVGKSSLLNALAGEERALVAAEPGTTRDYVEARVVWEGVVVTLVDTAGEREADTEVERRGVVLGRARAGRADVRLWVRDVTAPGVAGPAGAVEVWNKVDRGDAPAGAIGVSAVTGAGLAELRRAVLATAIGGPVDAAEGVVVTTARQRELLEAASVALTRGRGALRAGAPVELVAADVREALARLGEITGAEVGEEVLDRLFATFCIGK
jgi:tRNA modification GTPase